MLSKVVWGWNNGSVTTELFYLNETKKVYHLSKPPPTTPAHDISHFICGFHPDLEWDFSIEPNHFAEYNAVFMEHILLLFYQYPLLNDKELSEQIDAIDKHMRWFVYEYYRIPQTLGYKFTDLYLKNQFLSKINPDIISKFYYNYYCAAYLIEELNLDQNQIKIQLTLDQDSATINEECKSYITRIKSLGN